MARIFGSKLFREGYVPEKADYGLAQYWLPLILYYTGARAEEIAQLYVEDVSLDSDVPFIRIHGERDDQSVKTDKERQVPLHQHLFELGFREYIQELPSDDRVFPKLTMGSAGKYHLGVSKWFAAFVRSELGINRDGLKPLHAFRHAFITACRDRGVRTDVQNAITGHSQHNVASQYGSYTLDTMNEVVQAMPRCM